MISADSFGFATMNSTALRRARITARMKLPRVAAASAVVTPTTLDSAGRKSGAAAISLYLPRFFDHRGSATGTTSTPPISSNVSPAPKPPVRTSSTSLALSCTASISRMASAWLVERGLV